ncbi:MAG: YbaY family lipoprotein [Gammaproteobacteria bacterium]
MTVLTGTVTYRERMMLPPDAVIDVRLEDVSRADAPATVLASDQIQPDGAPPYGFRMEYDRASLMAGHSYALRARIESGGRLLFINDTRIDAFANGPAGPVEILVKRVASAPAGSPGLASTRWELVELAGAAPPDSDPERPAYLVFDAAQDRVRGYSGCNAFNGSFSSQGQSLAFSGVAATMMACVSGMALERKFLDMLETVSAYRIDGEILTLYAGDTPVARFRATGRP